MIQYELDYLGRIKFLHVEMPYSVSADLRGLLPSLTLQKRVDFSWNSHGRYYYARFYSSIVTSFGAILSPHLVQYVYRFMKYFQGFVKYFHRFGEIFSPFGAIFSSGFFPTKDMQTRLRSGHICMKDAHSALSNEKSIFRFLFFEFG